MKTFEKNYFAKGKKINGLKIVKISVRISELAKLAHTYKEEQWVTFEVAELMQPDQFGNTHTCYTNKLVETPELEENQVNDSAPPAKKKRSAKKDTSIKLSPEMAYYKEHGVMPSDDVPF
jgi:hypothetical protein